MSRALRGAGDPGIMARYASMGRCRELSVMSIRATFLARFRPDSRRIAACLLIITIALPAQAQLVVESARPPARIGYSVVNSFPHDRGAFTQGLIYRDGFLYESTGLNGRSSLRKVELATGKVLQQVDVDPAHFAEGLTDWKNRLVQITWQTQTGFVYDLETFKLEKTFAFPGEGWGLAHDGKHLILSDGSATLRFLDPKTYAEVRRVEVRYEGKPLAQLNELEMVGDELFANVWGTNFLVVIDPASGRVTGQVDLAGLLPEADRKPPIDVLNGIAWDAAGKRLFVTGKLWPKVFELRLDRPKR